jgi:hypothetical protein
MPRPFPVFSKANNLLFTVNPLDPGVFWARSWPNEAADELKELTQQWENVCNPAVLDAALLRLPDGRWCHCNWEHLGGQRLWAGRLVTARRAAELVDTPGFVPPADLVQQLKDDRRREAKASRQLNDTEKEILRHCRRRSHKGERIAQHVCLSYDHVRRLLGRLVHEGRLRNTQDGYRTV